MKLRERWYSPRVQSDVTVVRWGFAILASGEGRWEDIGHSWKLAGVMGEKGIPNRVDPWGTDYDHDWPTWRRMLPHYLNELS